MSPFELARLQIARKKGRTFFLVLIMAVSVGVSSSLLRLLEQSRRGLADLSPFADAIVGPKESSLDLLWQALTLQKTQERVIPYNLFQTLKSSQAPAFEDGTQSSRLEPMVVVPALTLFKDPVWMGTDFDFPKLGLGTIRGRWFQADSEVVVGEKWARDHGLDLNSTLEGPHGQYRVTGILESQKSPWNETVFAPFTPLRQVAQNFKLLPKTVWNDNVLDFFLIKGITPAQRTSLDHLINERTVAQILWLQPELEKLKDLTGQSSSLFELMAFLIGFLALVALSGLLISEVQSLETQILTLRAMGYSRKELYSWMALEGFFMAVASVLLGIVLDLTITPLLQDSIAGQLPVFRFSSLPVWTSAPLWIFILFCVPLSLLIPMQRILKKSLSAALRK